MTERQPMNSGAPEVDRRGGRPRSKALAVLLRLGKWSLLALVLYFVGKTFIAQMGEVSWSSKHFDPLMLFLAGLLLLISYGLNFVLYGLVLGRLGQSPGWLPMIGICWVSQLGKYLPGKVGSVAGMVYLLCKRNVSGRAAVGAILVVEGLSVIVGLLAAVPLAVWTPIGDYVPLAWLWCVGLLLVGMVCLHPRVFGGLVNFVLRGLGREPLKSLPKLRDYLLPVLIMALLWILAGAGLWCVARALGPVSASRLPLFVAANSLALSAGLMAVFAPAGVGVREGVLWVVLGPVVGQADAALVAVVLRVLQIAVDIVLGLAGFVLMSRLPAAEAAGTGAPRGRSAAPDDYPHESYDEAYYRSMAEEADRRALSYRLRIHWLDRELNVQPGERVVDLGSGSGAVSRHLAVRGAVVEAVDLSEHAVAAARQLCRGLPISFTACDAQDCTHLQSGAFDKVVSCDLIEHVHDRSMRGLFREAWRLLRPGGLFFLYSPNAEHWIERLKARDFILKNPVSHIRVRRPEEVVAALEQCNFQIAHVARFGSWLPLVKYLEWLWIRLPVYPGLGIYRVCLVARKPVA